MKKKKLFVSLIGLSFAGLSTFGLASCGKEDVTNVIPTDITSGKDGTDGKNGTNGVSIISIEKTSSEDNVDTYTITFSDETTTTFQITNGVGTEGPAGKGIQSASINENGEFVVTYTDGTTENLGSVVGKDGKDYEKKEYTVTLSATDEYEGSTIAVTEGNTVILPVLTMDGYSFEGWFTDSGEQVFDTTGIFKDLSLTARFTKLEEQATIYLMGGSTYTGSVEETIGSVFENKLGLVYASLNRSMLPIDGNTKLGDLNPNCCYGFYEARNISNLKSRLLIENYDSLMSYMIMSYYGFDFSTMNEYGLEYDYKDLMRSYFGDNVIQNEINIQMELFFDDIYGTYGDKLDGKTFNDELHKFIAKYADNTEEDFLALLDDEFNFTLEEAKEHIESYMKYIQYYYPIFTLESQITEDAIKAFDTFKEIDVNNASIGELFGVYAYMEKFLCESDELTLSDEAKNALERIVHDYRLFYTFANQAYGYMYFGISEMSYEYVMQSAEYDFSTIKTTNKSFVQLILRMSAVSDMTKGYPYEMLDWYNAPAILDACFKEVDTYYDEVGYPNRSQDDTSNLYSVAAIVSQRIALYECFEGTRSQKQQEYIKSLGLESVEYAKVLTKYVLRNFCNNDIDLEEIDEYLNEEVYRKYYSANNTYYEKLENYALATYNEHYTLINKTDTALADVYVYDSEKDCYLAFSYDEDDDYWYYDDVYLEPSIDWIFATLDKEKKNLTITHPSIASYYAKPFTCVMDAKTVDSYRLAKNEVYLTYHSDVFNCDLYFNLLVKSNELNEDQSVKNYILTAVLDTDSSFATQYENAPVQYDEDFNITLDEKELKILTITPNNEDFYKEYKLEGYSIDEDEDISGGSIIVPVGPGAIPIGPGVIPSYLSSTFFLEEDGFGYVFVKNSDGLKLITIVQKGTFSYADYKYMSMPVQRKDKTTLIPTDEYEVYKKEEEYLAKIEEIEFTSDISYSYSNIYVYVEEFDEYLCFSMKFYNSTTGVSKYNAISFTPYPNRPDDGTLATLDLENNKLICGLSTFDIEYKKYDVILTGESNAAFIAAPVEAVGSGYYAIYEKTSDGYKLYTLDNDEINVTDLVTVDLEKKTFTVASSQDKSEYFEMFEGAWTLEEGSEFCEYIYSYYWIETKNDEYRIYVTFKKTEDGYVLSDVTDYVNSYSCYADIDYEEHVLTHSYHGESYYENAKPVVYGKDFATDDTCNVAYTWTGVDYARYELVEGVFKFKEYVDTMEDDSNYAEITEDGKLKVVNYSSKYIEERYKDAEFTISSTYELTLRGLTKKVVIIPEEKEDSFILIKYSEGKWVYDELIADRSTVNSKDYVILDLDEDDEHSYYVSYTGSNVTPDYSVYETLDLKHEDIGDVAVIVWKTTNPSVTTYAFYTFDKDQNKYVFSELGNTYNSDDMSVMALIDGEWDYYNLSKYASAKKCANSHVKSTITVKSYEHKTPGYFGFLYKNYVILMEKYEDSDFYHTTGEVVPYTKEYTLCEDSVGGGSTYIEAYGTKAKALVEEMYKDTVFNVKDTNIFAIIGLKDTLYLRYNNLYVFLKDVNNQWVMDYVSLEEVDESKGVCLVPYQDYFYIGRHGDNVVLSTKFFESYTIDMDNHGPIAVYAWDSASSLGYASEKLYALYTYDSDEECYTFDSMNAQSKLNNASVAKLNPDGTIYFSTYSDLYQAYDKVNEYTTAKITIDGRFLNTPGSILYDMDNYFVELEADDDMKFHTTGVIRSKEEKDTLVDGELGKTLSVSNYGTDALPLIEEAYEDESFVLHGNFEMSYRGLEKIVRYPFNNISVFFKYSEEDEKWVYDFTEVISSSGAYVDIKPESEGVYLINAVNSEVVPKFDSYKSYTFEYDNGTFKYNNIGKIALWAWQTGSSETYEIYTYDSESGKYVWESEDDEIDSRDTSVFRINYADPSKLDCYSLSDFYYATQDMNYIANISAIYVAGDEDTYYLNTPGNIGFVRNDWFVELKVDTARPGYYTETGVIREKTKSDTVLSYDKSKHQLTFVSYGTAVSDIVDSIKETQYTCDNSDCSYVYIYDDYNKTYLVFTSGAGSDGKLGYWKSADYNVRYGDLGTIDHTNNKIVISNLSVNNYATYLEGKTFAYNGFSKEYLATLEGTGSESVFALKYTVLNTTAYLKIYRNPSGAYYVTKVNIEAEDIGEDYYVFTLDEEKGEIVFDSIGANLVDSYKEGTKYYDTDMENPISTLSLYDPILNSYTRLYYHGTNENYYRSSTYSSDDSSAQFSQAIIEDGKVTVDSKLVEDVAYVKSLTFTVNEDEINNYSYLLSYNGYYYKLTKGSGANLSLTYNDVFTVVENHNGQGGCGNDTYLYCVGEMGTTDSETGIIELTTKSYSTVYQNAH